MHVSKLNMMYTPYFVWKDGTQLEWPPEIRKNTRPGVRVCTNCYSTLVLSKLLSHQIMNIGICTSGTAVRVERYSGHQMELSVPPPHLLSKKKLRKDLSEGAVL